VEDTFDELAELVDKPGMICELILGQE
jgi:hypothetical protein